MDYCDNCEEFVTQKEFYGAFGCPNCEDTNHITIHDRKRMEESINNKRVYVSKEEWAKLSIEAKLELISLSNMTGEAVTDSLDEIDKAFYNFIVYEENN